MNYWVICITEDNLQIALQEQILGFKQSKCTRVRSFSPGDAVTFYVSRVALTSYRPVQKFVGQAEVKNKPYKSTEIIWKGDLFPIRIELKSISNASCEIKPLIDKLSFIKNKKHWGGVFMGGILRIPASDFDLIQETMRNV